jgi:hypothetical protein
MVRIGITLDGVLRDFISRFISMYEKVNEVEFNNPITSLDLMSQFKFESEEEFYKFLYEEYSLELFGHSNEVYRAAMIDLNRLYDTTKDSNEIIIISKEHGNSIPATLFFLSKTSCRARNYKFIKSEDEVWNYCDVLITAHPDHIKNVPEGKLVIKIKTEYNDSVSTKYEFESLKNVMQHGILSYLNEHMKK